jgi:hypothetical protein
VSAKTVYGGGVVSRQARCLACLPVARDGRAHARRVHIPIRCHQEDRETSGDTLAISAKKRIGQPPQDAGCLPGRYRGRCAALRSVPEWPGPRTKPRRAGGQKSPNGRAVALGCAGRDIKGRWDLPHGPVGRLPDYYQAACRWLRYFRPPGASCWTAFPLRRVLAVANSASGSVSGNEARPVPRSRGPQFDAANSGGFRRLADPQSNGPNVAAILESVTRALRPTCCLRRALFSGKKDYRTPRLFPAAVVFIRTPEGPVTRRVSDT